MAPRTSCCFPGEGRACLLCNKELLPCAWRPLCGPWGPGVSKLSDLWGSYKRQLKEAIHCTLFNWNRDGWRSKYLLFLTPAELRRSNMDHGSIWSRINRTLSNSKLKWKLKIHCTGKIPLYSHMKWVSVGSTAVHILAWFCSLSPSWLFQMNMWIMLSRAWLGWSVSDPCQQEL